MQTEGKGKRKTLVEESLKLNEMRLEALVQLNQMGDAPLSRITHFAMEEAIRLTGSTIGYISFLNEDETVLTMHAWSKTALAECRIVDKPLVYPLESTGLWGEAVRQRRPIITNDYAAAHPWKKGYPEGHVNLVRHMNVPIFEGKKIVAVAGVGNKPADYDESDVRQLTLLMEGMWRFVQRRKVEEELERSYSLLKATLESTADGLLVVDQGGKIVAYNQKFAQMWRLPETVLSFREDDRALAYVLEQLPAPESFLRKVQEIYSQPEAESWDLLELKDGRVFERCSQPQRIGQDIVGRVWSFRDITSRKRAEEALAEEAIRRRILMEQSRDGIVILDQTGKVYEANQRFVEMLGYSAEETRRLHVWDWDVQWSREELLEQIQCVDVSGDHFETRHRRQDGSIFDVEISANGAVLGGQKLVFCVCRDISQRKAGERALRESEEKYRFLVNQLPAVVFKGYRDWSVDFFDNKIETLTGYNKEDFNSRRIKWSDLTPPEDLDYAKKIFINALKTDGIFVREHRIRRKDGDIRWIQCRGQIIFDTEKKIDHVSGVTFDVTPRKEAEEALRQSEEKYRLLVKQIPAVVFKGYADWSVDFFDNKVEALTGYSKEEFDCRRVKWCDLIFPPDLKGAKDKLIVGGKNDGAYSREYRIRKKDGGIAWVQAMGQIFYDAANNLDYVSGLLFDITARKQAEEELRIREAKLSSIFRAAPTGIGVVVDRMITEVNQRVAEMTGYSMQELIGQPAKMLYPTEEEFVFVGQEKYRQIMEKGTGMVETRWRRKDGSIIEIILSSTPIVAGDLAAGVTFAALDITERKRAEEALLKYEFIANTAKDSMTLIDRNYVYEAANAAYCRAHGKAREEVVGTSVPDVWGKDTFEKAIKGYLDRCFAGQAVEFEGWIEFGQQGRGCYHVFYNPYFNAQGEVAYAAVVSHDITERKGVEEALRQSEAKYRQLVDQIPAVVYRGNPDWSLDCFDRKIEDITGYSLEEFNSRRKTWLDLIFPEDLEQAQKDFLGALKGEGSYVTEHRIRTKDGEVRWLQARNRIIPDAAGEVDFVSGVLFDITERKELEDQLNRAQRMEAIGILAGGLAHDFNNLLTAIMGYGEMMLLNLRKEDPFYAYVEEITKAANRGAALTNQLLAFSRKQIMQPRVINLNDVVLDMDMMLRRLIGDDIELVSSIDRDLGLVKADPSQIEQILMNLAVNARDAMPNGGKLTIETANITLDRSYARSHVGVSPGPYAMLAVSDNGVGMEAATLARIFDPFFTTKESGKGTGLGLATVYGIVKQSGGHIWVYSEPGRGTAFKVYLPRVEEKNEEPKAKAAPSTSLAGKETILVVEDDAALRELISRALGMYGFKVLEAGHGGEALLICEREKDHIHLMLTDVVMPQISGTALAERLQRLHPEMKVLYMSGYTENAVVHHGVLDSRINFIAKPFRMLALVQKVREVLDSVKETSPFQ